MITPSCNLFLLLLMVSSGVSKLLNQQMQVDGQQSNIKCSKNEYSLHCTTGGAIRSKYIHDFTSKIRILDFSGNENLIFLTHGFMVDNSLETINIFTTGDITMETECFSGLANLREIRLSSKITFGEKCFLGCKSLNKLIYSGLKQPIPLNTNSVNIFESNHNVDVFVRNDYVEERFAEIERNNLKAIEDQVIEGLTYHFSISKCEISGKGVTSSDELNLALMNSITTRSMLHELHFLGKDSNIAVKTFGYMGYDQITAILFDENLNLVLNRGCFMNMKQLKIIKFPRSLSSIPSYAFSNCSLKSVELPPNVATIGESAFKNNNIQMLTISESMTTIGNYAFADNKIKGYLKLPNNLNYIGIESFTNNKIEKIQFNSIITIDNKAFYGCKNLNIIKFMIDAKFGSEVFSRCDSIRTIKYFGSEVLYLNDDKNKIFKNNNLKVEVIVGDNYKFDTFEGYKIRRIAKNEKLIVANKKLSITADGFEYEIIQNRIYVTMTKEMGISWSAIVQTNPNISFDNIDTVNINLGSYTCSISSFGGNQNLKYINIMSDGSKDRKSVV